MEYKEFIILYESQLAIGKLIGWMTTYQYETIRPDFINLLIAEAEVISLKLGAGYFNGSFWLTKPLDGQDAYQVYTRQKAVK